MGRGVGDLVADAYLRRRQPPTNHRRLLHLLLAKMWPMLKMSATLNAFLPRQVVADA